MDISYQYVLAIGCMLLLGLLTSSIAQRSFLPRVTLLLLFGLAIGDEGLRLIPASVTQQFDLIAQLTLLMVGFLLGGKLTRSELRPLLGEVLWISLCAALLTAVVVTLGLMWAGIAAGIAIILGCIASATAPAAVMDVVSESQIKSRFSSLLLSIVALDDVWALILFGVGMALVGTLNGNGDETSFLVHAAIELGGAIILGLVLGFPAAYVTGRAKKGQPILTEALGLVFVCGGLAMWLGVSYLIAAMVMGAVIANVAKHHEYPFHEIENIESPFMVIFFVLAGASLEWGILRDLGLITCAYIACRVVGKILGASMGARISGAPASTSRWIGAALLPQAGVAIGMALVAANQFPEYRQTLLLVVISSTVLFEVIGPVFTRLALKHTGGTSNYY